MQYREYGKTGIKVSVLGFGTLRFPKVKGRANADLFVEILRHAFDLGVNYVDTAAMDVYGTEAVVGKAIRGRRDKVYVSTKNHYRGKSTKEWRKLLDRSLRRLDVSYVDFYHLHNLHWDVYRKQLVPGGIMKQFERAKDEGLVLHRCFSSHDTPENVIKLIDTGEFEGVLMQYNLLDRANEQAIAYAHEKGLGVAIMGPVGGGRLAAPLEKVRGLVGETTSTPEIALRFVLSNPHVTLALSGMNTAQMVEENVAAASRKEPLSAGDRRRILQVLGETRRLSDLYCTGCGYCLPCPNNVYIPGNLEAMNYYKVWGLEEHARELYKRMGKNKKRRWAEDCIECGACEARCPQNIPIRKRLQETAATLGQN